MQRVNYKLHMDLRLHRAGAPNPSFFKDQLHLLALDLIITYRNVERSGTAGLEIQSPVFVWPYLLDAFVRI